MALLRSQSDNSTYLLEAAAGNAGLASALHWEAYYLTDAADSKGLDVAKPKPEVCSDVTAPMPYPSAELTDTKQGKKLEEIDDNDSPPEEFDNEPGKKQHIQQGTEGNNTQQNLSTQPQSTTTQTQTQSTSTDPPGSMPPSSTHDTATPSIPVLHATLVGNDTVYSATMLQNVPMTRWR